MIYANLLHHSTIFYCIFLHTTKIFTPLTTHHSSLFDYIFINLDYPLGDLVIAEFKSKDPLPAMGATGEGQCFTKQGCHLTPQI